MIRPAMGMESGVGAEGAGVVAVEGAEEAAAAGPAGNREIMKMVRILIILHYYAFLFMYDSGKSHIPLHSSNRV